MSYPKEFEHSPLVDATIEVRFDSMNSAEILPGILYSQLRSEFPTINELPTLQIPLPIRQNTPSLKYQSTHRLESEEYILNIGPNVLGLGCKIIPGLTKYPGWKPLLEKFKSIISVFQSLDQVSEYKRLGVRYVNFFERNDLFKELRIELKTGWEGKGLQKDKQLTFFIKEDEYQSRVQINNWVHATPPNQGKPKKGQIIDIDTFSVINDKKPDLVKMASKAHSNIENIFFNILSEDLKQELGAKYE